jgi:asparagine synthase (glutamine-hydrolysing)
MLLGAASDEFNGGYSVGVAGDAGWDGYIDGLRGMARTTVLREHPDLAAWWTYCDQPLLTDEAVNAYAGRSLADPYPAYLASEYWKIQQYNCWHEDRSAAGSGIEARVPFLDHRLVELAMSVPPQLRERLFWNKRILRDAMRGILPDDALERPKGHFFYEDDIRHTYRWVLRMLAQDGASLVEQALAAPGARDLFDRAAMFAMLEQLPAHPDSAQVEVLLRAVNVGLLSAMVSDLPPPTAATPICDPPRAVEVSDWDVQADSLADLVGLRVPLDVASVPHLADGVDLLTSPGTGEWYLVVNGTIEFVLADDDSGYLRFLRAVDGVNALSAILAALDCPLDDLRPVLTDLVEQGLLELR